ncbi:hypothetical protein HC251_01080 [Iamia sp. SCSIO 61187]|uniref:hypothetical protein n=1 Tax=Iamia sp. SCSIO 61187 TaxID=2722752 RepID=UPI001C62EF0F|nr:hypothetical protein [Iamia sp. SCSIO 61187]QYG91164.1 hypothetical protein HC251_01080 [Iamia sp. SCSIO 61187]
MIPLSRHLAPHLAALLAQLDVDTRVSPAGGALICDVVTLADRPAAQEALHQFHLERWRRPVGGSGPANTRLSDLGELVGALLLYHHGLHTPESIYPLTFSASGPAAQPPGLDVLGVRLHAGAGPLVADEYLHVAEAKSTLDADAGNAISGIQRDVAKSTSERIADSIFILKWLYEREADPEHLRLPLLMTGSTSIVGSILIDSNECDLEGAVASIFSRLEGRVTPTGALLERVVLLALPDAEAFVTGAL